MKKQEDPGNAEEVSEKRKSKKTSVLANPRTECAADWIARVRGMSKSAAYAHAVAMFADATEHKGKTFSDMYHPHEGVWWCRMFVLGLTQGADDELLTAFVSAHRPFFLDVSKGKIEPNEQRIIVLWPGVSWFSSVWHRTKQSDAWKAGENMQQALRAAKINPPPWGPGHAHDHH